MAHLRSSIFAYDLLIPSMIATSPGRSDCVFSTRRLGGQATTTWGFEHDSSSGAQSNAVCPSRDFRGSREPGRRSRRPTIYNPAVSDDSGHRFAGHSAAAAMSSIPLNFPRQRGQGFVMATCNSVTEQLKE